ncbi:MAG: sugar transferase [Acidobacteria bacterium]|nr:MAG: sugar transferase [Acidobacteriota bacterium]REK09277.1 MAG: sugar transferase [Acidobacteriota bacterium]
MPASEPPCRDSLPDGLPRGLEAALATLALLALSPLAVVLAACVKASSRGPVLFRQTRVGRHGRTFVLLKLRTMRSNEPGSTSVPAPQVTAAGDRRITGFGRLLRATKLDELPQLWHVARGEMSLVGPRPEVPAYVDLDEPLWRRVLAARPGLTDPTTLRLRDEEILLARSAEKLGRDPATVYRERLLPLKLQLSARYLEKRSAGSDLRVLLGTLASIVRRPRVPELEELELEVREPAGTGPA